MIKLQPRNGSIIPRYRDILQKRIPRQLGMFDLRPHTVGGRNTCRTRSRSSRQTFLLSFLLSSEEDLHRERVLAHYHIMYNLLFIALPMAENRQHN